MTEVYPNTVWNRKKWVAERDKAGVAKGACSKISAGDELDRFHKDFAKGFARYSPAAERLAEKMAIYVAALAKSKGADDKKWSTRVNVQVVDKAKGIVSDVQKINDAREAFIKGVKFAKAAWPKVKTEALVWMTSDQSQPFKPAQLKVLVAALQAVETHGTRMRYVSDDVSKQTTVGARKIWYHVDGGGAVDLEWIETADTLIKGLPDLK